MLANILKDNNVNNEGMRFDPGARTALAFVTLTSEGEREFMFYRNPSADMLLEESELDFDLIKKVNYKILYTAKHVANHMSNEVSLWQAKIFHYGSISLITEPCKSAHIAAAKAAKEAGVILSYDPNLRLPLWPSPDNAREEILSIWETADIIKVFYFIYVWLHLCVCLSLLLSTETCCFCLIKKNFQDKRRGDRLFNERRRSV